MKVVCPGCQKEYQIEDHRIPARGIRMRCTACQTAITVAPPDAAPAAPPPPAGPPAPAAPSVFAAPPGPPGPPAVSTKVGVAPPVVPPRPGPPVRHGGTLQGMVAVPPPKAGGALFADLPAPKAGGSDPFADLPARKSGGSDPFADLPAPKAGGSDPFADLPAAKPAAGTPFADLPAPKAGGGEPFADLPARKQGGSDPFADLPAPKSGGSDPFADLPAPSPAAAPAARGADRDPFADLFPPTPGARPASVPPPARRVSTAPGAPAARAGMTDLPALKAGVTDLPGLRAGVVDLPVAKAGVTDLPMAKAGVTDLPAPKAGVTDLPVPKDITDLPVHKDDPFGGLDLSAAPPAGGAAPAAKEDPFAGLDLPSSPPAPGGMAGPVGLPVAAASHPPVAASIAPAAPAPPSIAPAAPAVPREMDLEGALPPLAPRAGDQKGGTAFGELDLGEPSGAPAHDLNDLGEEELPRPPAAGTEMALELEGIRPSISARPPSKVAAAPTPRKKKGGPAPLALVGLLLVAVVAFAAVPYLLGYGPFALKLFRGGSSAPAAGSAGPSPGAHDGAQGKDAGTAAAAAAADGGADGAAAASIWGDMPAIDERFLAQPDQLVDGVDLEQYVAAGEALLKLQEPGYLTKERFDRLCRIPELNGLVPMLPSQVLGRLRELSRMAFDRALARNPSAPPAMAGSGRVALMDGDVAKAVADFEQAASRGPDDPQYLFDELEAVFALHTNDRFSRAERILGQLEPMVPDDPRIDMFWGDLQVGYQDFPRAQERYLAAVAKVRASRGLPPPPCSGDACPEVADAADAVDAPEAGAPAHPADDALVDLVYGRLVDFDAKIALLRQSDQISSSDPTFHDPPAAFLERAGRVRDEGRTLLAQPVTLDARYGVALAQFGLTTHDAATLQQARSVLEQVRTEAQSLLLMPLDPLFYLGLIYKQAHELDAARGIFKEISAQDDTYPGVYMMQVQLSYSPGELSQQLPANIERLKADPNNPELQLRVAVCAFYAGQLDLAEKTFQTILAANPDSADANHYLGRIAFSRGDLTTARPLLLKAIQSTVTPVSSYYLYLGWVYEEQGDFGDAVAQLKLAKTLDDTSWEAYWRLGEIYTRLRVSDAQDTPLALLTRAAELNPKSADVQASLGRYQEEYGDPDAAADYYRKALALVDAGEPMEPADVGAVCTALGKLLQQKDHPGAEAALRRALTVGVQIEDAQRASEHRPTALYTARWYWEAAYRLAETLRDDKRLPEAATYFLWALPYVPGQPEEMNAHRALAVIQQVVPAAEIIPPEQARTQSQLP